MGNILKILRNWLYDASMLIAPERCAICGRRLRKGEQQICLACYSTLPFTHYKGAKGNKVERIFWGQIPICRANSFLFYYPHAESSYIFLDLKYRNRPKIGYVFGRCMATELIDTDFFDDIDIIIPLPLAKKRLRKRGYNQSEAIAKGISDITKIPLDTQSVIRTISNPTQTRLRAQERKENVKNIFKVDNVQRIRGKHILLIDDIVTTGATLISCAQEIVKVANTRISIMTLGLAGSHFTLHRKS